MHIVCVESKMVFTFVIIEMYFCFIDRVERIVSSAVEFSDSMTHTHTHTHRKVHYFPFLIPFRWFSVLNLLRRRSTVCLRLSYWNRLFGTGLMDVSISRLPHFIILRGILFIRSAYTRADVNIDAILMPRRTASANGHSNQAESTISYIRIYIILL